MCLIATAPLIYMGKLSSSIMEKARRMKSLEVSWCGLFSPFRRELNPTIPQNGARRMQANLKLWQQMI